ncbi:GNAT family N-acetyltransferase [Brevundimonas sp.]|uniref:GNAT family N-acetyltransferase n=1 Tax=Brevundimonas sp. TaxID=1871086 RepID=UPI001D6CFAAF|nr:GNAT family N-acetyltransferase [Brevundimonas sp.]MBL0947179.1 GNAT family N-acetyltransferase [Brevundimonas sp.]
MQMGLRVEMLGVDALSADHWALWNQMRLANPALSSPYFRPEFTRIAAEVTPGARVAVLHRGGDVVGFFPHQTRGGAIQPLAAPLNDYHGIISLPETAPTLNHVADLLGGNRLNVSGWVGPGGAGQVREAVMSVLPEEGFEPWYAERRTTQGKYFKDKERARRSLEAELGPVRVELGLRDPKLLTKVIDLKRDQYRRSGLHDVFACGWTVRLLEALMRADGDFGASIAALWAGDRLCALEYSLHADSHYHFWFPAYVPGLARCSPGVLLSLDTMRQGSKLGYRVFDFGFGGEHYKKYFCNASQSLHEAVIHKPGLSAALGDAAVATLETLVGAGRGEALRTSLRRRWSAIEACEVDGLARARGLAVAARAALRKTPDILTASA